MVSNLHIFILISILGKRRKNSQGAKSGKKGVADNDEKKQISINFTLLFTCYTFFGQGENGHFHWNNCYFVSGSYP